MNKNIKNIRYKKTLEDDFRLNLDDTDYKKMYEDLSSTVESKCYLKQLNFFYKKNLKNIF